MRQKGRNKSSSRDVLRESSSRSARILSWERYSCFTDEETKAQRAEEIPPRPYLVGDAAGICAQVFWT